jgi:membrane-bound ClpP family serine protease
MIDRIFRNPKTTLIGLILMSVGLIFVWFEKATLPEYGAFLMGGFALMMSKDKPTTTPKKGT